MRMIHSLCVKLFIESFIPYLKKNNYIKFIFLTVGILDLLLQNTPKQEQKLKEFFTLPAVKLLLDWFKLNPVHLQNPILKSSRFVTQILFQVFSVSQSPDGIQLNYTIVIFSLFIAV